MSNIDDYVFKSPDQSKLRFEKSPKISDEREDNIIYLQVSPPKESPVRLNTFEKEKVIISQRIVNLIIENFT